MTVIRYIFLGMNTILPYWRTSRLVIRDATLADVPKLRDAFNACSYVETWDPTFMVYPDEEFAALVRKSMDEGDDRNFRLQAITVSEDQEVIGYFHCYHDIPRPETVFISMFVIHPAWQKHRFGVEVVEGLAEELGRLGCESIVLKVYMKNWPAMRFWIGRRFTTILEWRGEALHADGAHAQLILERRLS